MLGGGWFETLIFVRFLFPLCCGLVSVLLNFFGSDSSGTQLRLFQPQFRWYLNLEENGVSPLIIARSTRASKRDSFRLPYPADVFNELAGHKYFSRMDLASGF